MTGKKLIIFALVAGVLMMQFSPAWTKHRGRARSPRPRSRTPGPRSRAPAPAPGPAPGPGSRPQVDLTCAVSRAIQIAGRCLPCTDANTCIGCFTTARLGTTFDCIV